MTNPTVGKLSIRKDDQVQVIAGREKGKTGKVISVDRDANRVLVEKVNMVKRHSRPTKKYPQGGIIEKETPIHYSNVLLMCAKCNRGVRHGVKFVEKSAGKKKKGAEAAPAKQVKIRVCKRCGESLETTA